MDEIEIPESTVKAVAKKLKHYMEGERQEQAFDLTTSNSATGYFHSGRGLGGSYHYNRLQDKHLQHSTKNPRIKARLDSMGPAQKGMLDELEKTAKKTCRPKIMATETNQFKKQKYYKESEKSSLLDATARVLLQDHYMRSDPLHMECAKVMNKEESERSYSAFSSTSRSATRKVSSGSLGSSGRKSSSRSSSVEVKEDQLETPLATPASDNDTTVSVDNIDHSTQQSSLSDDPSKSQEQPSVSTNEEDDHDGPASTGTPASITETAATTYIPSTASSQMPTVSTDKTEAATSAPPALLYNPQQPGIPIFYALSPNQLPPGANILTPFFQPGMPYPSHLLAPGTLPQPEKASASTVRADQEKMKSLQDSQTPCPEDVNAATNSRERPVIIMQNASVSTSTMADATTQTLVHAETQTEKSALFKISERKRKKEKMSKLSEAPDKGQQTTKSQSSDKLVEQPLLQHSPLVVKNTPRPTSSSSSRSSRIDKSKDPSSKTKKEALLSTKAYSASNPNVVHAHEMRSRSGSSSSTVSVSSTKSDSAIQKKKRVSKECKTTKSKIHQGLSHSVHSDSADNPNLNKPLINDVSSPRDESQQKSISPVPTAALASGAPTSLSEVHKESQSNPPSKTNDETDAGTSGDAVAAGVLDSNINGIPSAAKETGSTSISVPPIIVNEEGTESLADDKDNLHSNSTAADQTEQLKRLSGEAIKSETQGIRVDEESRGLDSEAAKKSTTELIACATTMDEASDSALQKDESNDLPSDKVVEDDTNRDSESNAKNEVSANSPTVETKEEAHSTPEFPIKDELIVASSSDVVMKDNTSGGTTSDRAMMEDNELNRDETQSDTTSTPAPNAADEDKPGSSLDDAIKDEVKEDLSVDGTVKDEISPGNGEADPVTEVAAKDKAHKTDLGTNAGTKHDSKASSDSEVKDKRDQGIKVATEDESHPASNAEIKGADLNTVVAAKDAADSASDNATKDKADCSTEVTAKDEIKSTSNANEKSPSSEGAVKNATSDAAVKDEINLASNAAANQKTEGPAMTDLQDDTGTIKTDISTNSEPQAEPIPEETASSVVSPETDPSGTTKARIKIQEDTDSETQALAEGLPASTQLQESPVEVPSGEDDKQEREISSVVAPSPEVPIAIAEKVPSKTDVSSLSSDKDLQPSSQLPESVDSPKENIGPSLESQNISAETEMEKTSNKTEDESNQTLPDEKPMKSENDETQCESSATPKSSEQIQESTNASPEEATKVSSQQLQQLPVTGEAITSAEDTSKLPQESIVTDTEQEQSDSERKSILLSPEQSGQESISEQISDSPSQDEESTIRSGDHKFGGQTTLAPADGNESSVTEVDEVSDMLTPVTDDADMSRESAAETDSSLPLPTAPSPALVPPTERQTINEPHSSKDSGNEKEAKEGPSSSTRESNLDKLSDISSTVTSTSAEESKESETQ